MQNTDNRANSAQFQLNFPTGAELGNNKSRDPLGFINELFKPGICGSDLEKSLLLMFKKIKEEVSFPEFME